MSDIVESRVDKDGMTWFRCPHCGKYYSEFAALHPVLCGKEHDRILKDRSEIK